jgi:hypothetical protein
VSAVPPLRSKHVLLGACMLSVTRRKCESVQWFIEAMCVNAAREGRGSARFRGSIRKGSDGVAVDRTSRSSSAWAMCSGYLRRPFAGSSGSTRIRRGSGSPRATRANGLNAQTLVHRSLGLGNQAQASRYSVGKQPYRGLSGFGLPWIKQVNA